MLRNPSCGTQNMAVLRYILTAAPSSPRCICHRQRSATKPGTRVPRTSFVRGRRTWSRLPARSVLLHFVQRSPPETRTPQHAPRASESKSFYSMPKQKRSPFGNRFRFGRGRRTWSRLPARSVLLHFVQRSPPETRTPQHAPRASESKSFYSMPKQKRSPFGNRFRFGRGRRT